MPGNNPVTELEGIAKVINESNKSAIEADRLQDDRLGKQLKLLTATGEGSHDGAFHALHMLLLRYGDVNMVPDPLFDDILNNGNRLDTIAIDLKVAKEFPEFEITRNPVVLQKQYHRTKRNWNADVNRAIRAAKVSTQSANAMFSGIQLIAAHKSFEETKDNNKDPILRMVP